MFRLNHRFIHRIFGVTFKFLNTKSIIATIIISKECPVISHDSGLLGIFLNERKERPRTYCMAYWWRAKLSKIHSSTNLKTLSLLANYW